MRGAYLFLRFPRGNKPAADAGGAGGGGDRHHRRSRRRRSSAHRRRRVSRQRAGSRPACPRRRAWRVSAPRGEALKAHYGVAPIIYTSARVWRDDLGNAPADDLTESPLWLARYFFKPGPGGARRVRLRERQARSARSAAVGRRRQLVDSPVPGRRGEVPRISDRQRRHEPVQRRFKGARGARVRWLQRRLGIAESGRFDAATERAVRDFQDDNDLVSDGIIGPRDLRVPGARRRLAAATIATTFVSRLTSLQLTSERCPLWRPEMASLSAFVTSFRRRIISRRRVRVSDLDAGWD